MKVDRRLSYDPECARLAEYFLRDTPAGVTMASRGALAQTIQEAVEGWFQEQQAYADQGEP